MTTGTADTNVTDYHYEFETLKGYFAQSEDSTDDSKFDFVRFGIFIESARLTTTRSKRNLGS